MSYLDGSTKTFISTADLSTGKSGLNATGQGLCVKMDASNPGQIVLASSATDAIVGICMGAPKAGDYADVRLRSATGTAEGVAGGTIAIGAYLTSNASGQLIATTTAGNQVVGLALYSAVSGDVFEFEPMTGKF